VDAPLAVPAQVARYTPAVRRIAYLLQAAFRLVRFGLLRELVQQVRHGSFGGAVFVALAREIDDSRPLPRLCGELRVRPVATGDVTLLRSMLADRSLPGSERLEIARRLAMLGTGIRQCLVAEDSAGAVRFVQWLIPADESEALRRWYGDWFPALAPGEALMESVYILPAYRGTATFPCAVELVSRQALRDGVRRIRTIIPATNVKSLASCTRLGFRLYEVRVEQRSLRGRRRTVTPIASAADIGGLQSILPPGALTILLREAPPIGGSPRADRAAEPSINDPVATIAAVSAHSGPGMRRPQDAWARTGTDAATGEAADPQANVEAAASGGISPGR
jgi:hypothetical protein